MSADKIVSSYEERISRFEQLLYSHYCESRESRKKAADLQKELEATRAELAAERAKPRAGVAWAVKNKMTGTLDGSPLNNGHPNLHETKESAEKWIAGAEDRWQVVPYPIGDGADELKAAIDAKEKAEAEVAAWKEAANHLYPDAGSICSPDDLRSRITNLKGSIDNLHVRVNELKAEIAEVPPLDKWRVLATAKEIAVHAFNIAGRGLQEEALAGAAKWGLAGFLTVNSQEDTKPYPLKD